MVLKFEQVHLPDYYEEIKYMCSTWWYESKFYKDWNIPFECHDELFLHDAIPYLTLIGKDEEDRIGAFYLGALSPYMFNSKMKTALEIVWHVRKDLQSGMTVLQLLRAIDKMMEKEKVNIWGLALPNEEKYGKSDRVFGRFGYVLQDKLYMKCRNNYE